MKQLAAIASNTFKETIRDRVLAVIVVFALVMIAGGLWLGAISLGEQGRMMKDFGLVAVTGFGLIVAVFIAASLVHKEVEKRTVFVLFSKPVSRAAFITGKFFGLCGTMAVVLAGMGLFLFALVWLLQGTPSFMVLAAVVMIYVQLLAIMAVTIFFSTLGLGDPRERARHLRVRRRAAQPQRAGADAPRGQPGHRGVLVGGLRAHPQLSRRSTSRPGSSGSRRWPGVRSGSGSLYLLAYVVVVLALATVDLPPQGVLAVLRRVLAIVMVLVCAGGVVAYQATRPGKAPASPRVFVPSPKFFLDFSPSYRTSIADAYYLYMIQYYGEHVSGDGRLDSLPAMTRLVTTLSPHFTRGYLFSAFALIDAGRPDVAYEILQKGFEANPEEWRFPAYLAFFVYTFGEESAAKNKVAADWYQKAAAIPGSPSYLPRLAGRLLAKARRAREGDPHVGPGVHGGRQVRSREGRRGYSTRVLPEGREATLKALAPLTDTMPKDDFEALLADLFPEGEL